MIKILNLLRFSKIAPVAMLLLSITLALSVEAETLTPDEIQALKEQLTGARGVYTTLDNRVQCYVDQDISLQGRSKQLQERAGNLHREEKKLSSELDQRRFEAKGFQRDAETAQQEMYALQKKIAVIERDMQVRQAGLDGCKDKAWIFGFVCDLAGEISGLKKQLRELASKKEEMNIKIISRDKQLKDARDREYQATELLKKAQLGSAQNKREIQAVEAQIKVIKPSLTKIRAAKQVYSIELDTFEYTFAEFDALDPNSDRRSVIRRLRRESEDLDVQLIQARELLNENGLQLPSGERICAN